MRRIIVALACLGLVSGCASESSGGVHVRAPLRPSIDASPSMRAMSALRFAEAQIGKRYCWGGSGPSCFDCSGLVQSAWRWAGIALPRTSDAQGRALVSVPREEVRPGDILWWPGHVGLYAGAGTMIDAYNGRSGVVRRPAVIPVRVLRVPAP